ncbi:MAG: Rpn family recombination-promoting nuclease/putative transposase [Verrucomicrobiota bacterium]
MPEFPIHNPHDKIFKSVFSRKDAATEFFKKHLPSELTQHIDWQSLQLEPGSFVDEILKGSESDLLYKVQIKGVDTWLYTLFEHQTQEDKLMAFRLLRYMVRIWEQFLKQIPDAKKLPVILPIVLHQNKDEWKVSKKFSDLLDIPNLFKASVTPYTPDFSYEVVDLAAISPEQIQGHVAYRAALSLMKAAREDRILPWLKSISGLFDQVIREQEGHELLRTLLLYMLQIDGREAIDIEVIKDTINEEKIKEDIMSIAEQLRREGLQEGLQEGCKQTLIGQIDFAEGALGMKKSYTSDLEKKTVSELEQILDNLQVQITEKLKN